MMTDPLVATTVPGAVLVPKQALRLDRRQPADGSWWVDVEDVLRSPSPSVFMAVIRDRMAAGDLPDPKATLYRRGGQLLAVVTFPGEGRAPVFMALDDWPRVLP